MWISYGKNHKSVLSKLRNKVSIPRQYLCLKRTGSTCTSINQNLLELTLFISSHMGIISSNEWPKTCWTFWAHVNIIFMFDRIQRDPLVKHERKYCKNIWQADKINFQRICYWYLGDWFKFLLKGLKFGFVFINMMPLNLLLHSMTKKMVWSF